MNMMKRKQQNPHGVITIMISLLLTGVLSLGTMVIEAGRMQSARTQLDDANLSAGTSMIASYNADLYDRYGLLAIDNERFNLGRYQEYLEFNSDRSAEYKGNNISTFYTIDSVELQGLYDLTNPSVLKRQLLSRAKYNTNHQDYALNYYNMDYFISDYQSKADYVIDALQIVASGNCTKGSLSNVPADMQAALNTLYGVFSKTKKYDEDYAVTIKESDLTLLPSVVGPTKYEVPEEDIDAINAAVSDANTVLGTNGELLASNNGSAYKEVDVNVNVDFASDALKDFADLSKLPDNAVGITQDCHKMVQAIQAALNILNEDKEGTILINSYIVGNFPNQNYTVEAYNGPKVGEKTSNLTNATFAGACAEYAFSGNASEKKNQQTAYDYIIATRLVSNLYSTLAGSASLDRNNACSVAAHIAWAYYETCADVELLFRYNAVVPLSKSEMILPITAISKVNSAFASKDFLGGMRSMGIWKEEEFIVKGYDATNYRDALALALWFVPNSDKMLRVADLIQLEMRYRERYVEKVSASFLLNEQNTFCRVKCTGSLNAILPVISLSDGAAVDGADIASIKYIGY